LGKSFSFQLLEAVSGRQAERLEADLSQLVEAELLSRQGFPPKAVFTFRHALVRDTAYESLLKSRRQQLHQRAAQVLENEFPEDALPEIYRFQGEFFVQKNQTAEAEKAYLQALQIAREQSAKWHELLAAKSLARLWQSQGKIAEAHDLLSAVYDWFTEGFELPDLREAKALLEQCQQ
jgi:predicted ATPase